MAVCVRECSSRQGQISGLARCTRCQTVLNGGDAALHRSFLSSRLDIDCPLRRAVVGHTPPHHEQCARKNTPQTAGDRPVFRVA